MAILGILLPVLVIGLIVAAVVAFMRSRAVEGGGITFSAVLVGYVALAMLVSVFLLAGGTALLIKTGFSAAIGRDFSYDVTLQARYPPYELPYSPEPTPTVEPGYPSEPSYPAYPEPESWVDPSDNALRNDIAAGVTLVFLGLTLFAVHGTAAVVLRRRGAQGVDFVSRVYNLLGLAGASIVFLASGGGALHGIIRRYALETDNLSSWEMPHPGEPLALAVVFLPLSLWFGWRVWGLIVAAVVAFVRSRAAEGGGITFSGVLVGYVAVAMLVSVFLLAAGGALLIKAGFSGAVGRDFSYNTALEPRYPPYEPFYPSESGKVAPEPESWVDPSDNALRNDIAGGVTLVFLGLTLFAVHGAAAVVLRRRGAQGVHFVSRVYNLLGLTGASIAFLASGGVALHGVIRRYVLETENLDARQLPHPGDPLAFAVVFLALSLWFGWRVWQEFALEAPESRQGP